MGTGTSRQKLGERVKDARATLVSDKAMQAARTKLIRDSSPETLDVFVQSIADSFERCSPFSDPTLLVAFKANPEEVQRVMTKSCKKVLSAPIRADEFEWFKVSSCLCYMLLALSMCL